jgi:hypothetical protein
MEQLNEVFVVTLHWDLQYIRPMLWVFDKEENAKARYEDLLLNLLEGQSLHIFKEYIFKSKFTQ